MSTLQYLLQVNLCLLLFYGFYQLVLSNETFFRLNRIYLVSTALLSFFIPLLQADWIRSLFITRQVKEAAQNIAYVFNDSSVVIVQPQETWNMLELLTVLYIIGCAVFAGRFLWQLYKLRYLEAEGSGQAYSFFRRIVVSKELDGFSTIQEHEKIHAIQWHSADVLLFEIIAIINWFNPIVYAYKKAVKAIHEFIADEATASHLPSKSDYALLLVSNAFGVQTNQLTNGFYKPSLLKRRIIMLNKSKSKKIAILKYGLSAPLFAAMLILSAATVKVDRLGEYGDKLNQAMSTVIQPEDDRASLAAFLKRNPNVTGIAWQGAPDFVTIYLKGGKKEKYNLHDEVQMQKVRSKYGKLPIAPPPPPAPPVPPRPPKSVDKAKAISSSLNDSSKVPARKPLYYINGKEADEQIMQAINPANIGSVNVVKGAAAIKKYGRKAQDGAIEIILKPASGSSVKNKEVVVSGFPTPKENIIFTSVEVLPRFPGGHTGWLNFVKNYKYPDEAVENGISGRVIVQFIVEPDGSLSDIKSVKDLGYGTGEAAVELLKQSPKWEPGFQNGRPVRVAYTQQISLNLKAQ